MVKRKCGVEIQVMEYQYMVVDAFSPRPFRGNPAAVVLMNGELSDEIRQSMPPNLTWPRQLSFSRRRMDSSGFDGLPRSERFRSAAMPRSLLRTPYGNGLRRQKARLSSFLPATAGS
jgi:hypothetical protein